MMLLRPTNVTSTPRFWEILYNQFQAAFKEAKAANPVSPASKLPC
jgi:long-subunit acyl-CoA synthetase (AMP-forming)